MLFSLSRSLTLTLLLLTISHPLLANTVLEAEQESPAQTEETSLLPPFKLTFKTIGKKHQNPYKISKHLITARQYSLFLNAVASTDDPHHLFDERMESDPENASIRRIETASGYAYSIIEMPGEDRGKLPITFVNWLSAARFCNWMSNGHLSGEEGRGSTETGTYDLTQLDNNDITSLMTPNPNAAYLLPTQEEWTKAADSHHIKNIATLEWTSTLSSPTEVTVVGRHSKKSDATTYSEALTSDLMTADAVISFRLIAAPNTPTKHTHQKISKKKILKKVYSELEKRQPKQQLLDEVENDIIQKNIIPEQKKIEAKEDSVEKNIKAQENRVASAIGAVVFCIVGLVGTLACL